MEEEEREIRGENKCGRANAPVVLPILMISNRYIHFLPRRSSGDDTPGTDPFYGLRRRSSDNDTPVIDLLRIPYTVIPNVPNRTIEPHTTVYPVFFIVCATWRSVASYVNPQQLSHLRHSLVDTRYANVRGVLYNLTVFAMNILLVTIGSLEDLTLEPCTSRLFRVIQ